MLSCSVSFGLGDLCGYVRVYLKGSIGDQVYYCFLFGEKVLCELKWLRVIFGGVTT